MKDYKLLYSQHKFSRKRVQKNKVNQKVLFPIIFSLVFLVVFLMGSKFAISNEPLRTKDVIISRGDTLWSIAKTHYDIQGDIRAYIHRIREFNDLTTAQIFPGQVLKLPLN